MRQLVLFFLAFWHLDSLAESRAEILFSQPELTGISENFYIRRKPGPGNFQLTQWQTNPHTGKDLPVAVKWPVSEFTGFEPGEPREKYQAGNKDELGTSAAQAKGGTIGVYINSKDYEKSACQPRCKANIMLGHQFRSPVEVFDDPKNRLRITITAKVPTSTLVRPAHSFVNVRLRFEEKLSGRKISYGINLFSLHSKRDFDIVAVDPATGDIMCNSRFLPDMKFVALADGSDLAQSAPFKDFKTFKAYITYEGFKNALVKAKELGAGKGLSENPADYRLVHTHVEPELTQTSKTAPASLGAAFQGYQIAKEKSS